VKKKEAISPTLRDNGFRAIDYVKISLIGFALTALWGSMHTVILPLRLLDFISESQKNTYLGLLSGTGLILAMVVQPMAGLISDRSKSSWGRRRPFIFIGSVLALLFLPGIGISNSYGTLFITYCLLQVGSNIAQGPYQGFIPDLVSEQKRGMASGVKNLLEIIGGVALVRLVAIFMSRYSIAGGSSWLWIALAMPAMLLVVALAATMLAIKERPAAESSRIFTLSVFINSFRVDTRATPDFIWFLLSRLLIFMAFAIIQRFALYFLMDVVGLPDPAVAAANLLLVVGICMVVVVYPAGRLSDRMGRRPVILSSALIGALAIVLLFLSKNYLHVIVAGGLLGVSSGAFLSANWALATDLLPRGEAAKYLGLANIATAGASALALFSIGPMVDTLNGYSFNLGYSIMLLVCFMCFVGGCALLMKVRTRVS
jgi:Na+/melibiose symporter-like transporter